MYKLVIKDDEGNRTVVAFYRQEITIGRKEGNTIRLTEQNVSRSHARLFKSNNLVFIEDQQSYVGTFINKNKITERTRIQVGDEIGIGDYVIVLSQENENGDDDTILIQDKTPPTKSNKIKPVPVSEITGKNSSSNHTAIIDASSIQSDMPQSAYDLKPPHNKIIFQNNNWAGASFTVNRSIMTIGRAPDCDVIINHRSISENHAQITCNGNSVKIKDLGSSNGILVNGEKYNISLLTEGDIVELGHIKFRFCDTQSTYRFTPEDSGGSNKKTIFIVIAIIIAVAIAGTIFIMKNKNKNKNSVKIEKNNNDNNNVNTNNNNNNNNNNNDNLNNNNKVKNKILSPELMNLINSGKQLIKNHNWDKAEKVYKKILVKDPDNKEAKDNLKKIKFELTMKSHYNKGIQNMIKRKFEKSKDAFEAITSKSDYYSKVPKQMEKLFKAIIISVDSEIGKRKYEEARELLELANKIKNDNEHVIERLLYVDKRLKRRNVKIAKKRNRGLAKSLTDEAMKMAFSKPKDALKKAKQAISADYSYSAAYRITGIIYKNLDNKKQAVKYLKIYLKRAPKARDASAIRKMIESIEN